MQPYLNPSLDMSLKERLGLVTEPIFLMDGSAFIYRGFFANRNMQRSDGFPTNSLVVVTRILLRILREEQPKYFVFVKDGRGKNFRHELFPLYKANRDAMPEDLVRQIEPIQNMVQSLGFRLEISEGCEADDCIASLSERFSKEHPIVIISGDKDLKQCLGPNVYLWDPGSKEEKLLTDAQFRAANHIEPVCWPDVQALIGDASDNIPGVPGIGPKTAEKIFETYRNLEEIRDHFEDLPPKIQTKLRDHLEKMFLWRELTTLSRDVCAHLRLEDMLVRPLDIRACQRLSDEFELTVLKREIAALARQQGLKAESIVTDHSSPQVEEQANGPHIEQLSLFSDLRAQVLPEFSKIEALPDCKGKIVALIWQDGGQQTPQLAVDGDQGNFCWTGEMDLLCTWLKEASTLVLPDLKILLTTYPCWRDLLEAHQGTRIFDLGLAAWLISPEESNYGWTHLAGRLRPAFSDKKGESAHLALQIFSSLKQGLEKHGLDHLYYGLELPLVSVLATMELSGVAIDARAFRTFLNEVQQKLDGLTDQVYAAAGLRFNIRSAQQLAEVLFEKLKLPVPRKTRGGQASTSQQILEKLASQHTVVDSVLQYRKLEKIRSTYLDPLPRLMDAAGRIHTTFNQKGTATGRLSSSSPNLQNIPVRGQLGKRMRSCFIAGADRLLISADYSQVELRVLAHMSQDAALLEAFKSGEDIHTRTAALIYDLEPHSVSPDQRRNAKTINFGLIYGMGAQKLAQELKISLNEAKDFITRYFSRLTGLKAFYEQIEISAKKLGHVNTLGGRRRPILGIHSSNGQSYALARRQAINTVIQGSAADIIKLAMLAVVRDPLLRDMDSRLLLQVHDELLLDAPLETAQQAGERVAQLMQEVMPGGCPLSVPLLVDWGIGENWGEAH